MHQRVQYGDAPKESYMVMHQRVQYGDAPKESYMVMHQRVQYGDAVGVQSPPRTPL